MNITPAQLDAQYKLAVLYAGSLLDEVEKELDLPPFSMYAIGSRETNFNPYYLDHPGDGGHGRGWWQVDDRSHEIPDGWETDIEWQCYKGGEVLASCLEAADEDVIAAFNRYNSGQEKSQYTTGGDYGPDVESRRQYLISKHEKKDEEEFVVMHSLVNTLSGYCIDVAGESQDDRAACVQYRCKGTKNQGIIIEDAGDGYSRIKFDHSGKYLDNDPNRLEAVQFSRANVDGQLWVIQRLNQGTLRIMSKVDSRVVDVEGISTDEGARIIMWEWNGGPNQQWVLANFR